MTYRTYIIIIGCLGLIGALAFTIVIKRLAPCSGPGRYTLCHSASSVGLVLFFLSVFFALTAILTLLGFAIRLWFHKSEIYLDHLTTSLRQGILLTLCTIGALLLLLFQALTWWSGFLLIGIIVLLELYFTRQ